MFFFSDLFFLFLLFVRYYFLCHRFKICTQYRTQGNVLFLFGIMWQYLAYVGTIWIESDPQNTLNFPCKALTHLKSFVRIKESIQKTPILSPYVFLYPFFDWNWLKNNKKGSKDKADSHRTTQPKDYGIMAGQIWWLRRVVVFALPPFGTYSVSFWFFRLSALLKWLSFFSVFFFWKVILRGSNASHLTKHHNQNSGLCFSL